MLTEDVRSIDIRRSQVLRTNGKGGILVPKGAEAAMWRRSDGVSLKLAITWVKTGFGKRPLFICPDCKRRASVLFDHPVSGGQWIGCGECSSLRYRSETLSGNARKQHRRSQILMDHDFSCRTASGKPRGRRWHTHLALLRKLEKTGDLEDIEFEDVFGERDAASMLEATLRLMERRHIPWLYNGSGAKRRLGDASMPEQSESPKGKAPRASPGKSYVAARIACERLGIHESTLHKWAKAGRIGYIELDGGHRRYDVDTFVRRHEAKQQAVHAKDAPLS
ncbi:MAG: hypothetical protein WBX25_06170 [Rhodomicrobium sp.]